MKKGMLSPKIYKTADLSLPYQIYYPENYGKSKVPVVVFLHGSGERGVDNVKQLLHVIPYLTSKEIQAKFPCIVIVPQCPESSSWSPVDRKSWQSKSGEAITPSGAAVISLVEKISKNKNIYSSRIYLMGLSMGGFGTYDLLSRRPDLFAAGAPICGGADLAVIHKYSNIPIWIFHGNQDPVVPVKLSKEAYDEMLKMGVNVKYTEYDGAGHDIWEKAIREDGFLDWMFNQYKGKGIR
jgi:predicted peptidase